VTIRSRTAVQTRFATKWVTGTVVPVATAQRRMVFARLVIRDTAGMIQALLVNPVVKMSVVLKGTGRQLVETAILVNWMGCVLLVKLGITSLMRVCVWSVVTTLVVLEGTRNLKHDTACRVFLTRQNALFVKMVSA